MVECAPGTVLVLSWVSGNGFYKCVINIVVSQIAQIISVLAYFGSNPAPRAYARQADTIAAGMLDSIPMQRVVINMKISGPRKTRELSLD